jgi:hypothetical protein
MPKTQINLDGWQDYRGNNTGALLYVETSHQSAVPFVISLMKMGKGSFMNLIMKQIHMVLLVVLM